MWVDCIVEVWSNTYARNIECLGLLQKKVVRLLCGANRLDHKSRLFYNFRILKVPGIVELRICIIMFKVYHNHNKAFTQKYTRTNMKSMTLSVKGVKLWNFLDSSQIFCQNVHIKKLLS